MQKFKKDLHDFFKSKLTFEEWMEKNEVYKDSNGYVAVWLDHYATEKQLREFYHYYLTQT